MNSQFQSAYNHLYNEDYNLFYRDGSYIDKKDSKTEVYGVGGFSMAGSEIYRLLKN